MVVLSREGRAQAAPRGSLTRRLLGRDYGIAWLFLAPLIVVLLGLIAYPFVSAILLSLQRKMVGGEATWIGPGNYYELLFGAHARHAETAQPTGRGRSEARLRRDGPGCRRQQQVAAGGGEDGPDQDGPGLRRGEVIEGERLQILAA